jgi:hypothetical protein
MHLITIYQKAMQVQAIILIINPSHIIGNFQNLQHILLFGINFPYNLNLFVMIGGPL